MIWLGIDTATQFCTAGLWSAERSMLIAETRHDIGTGHAEILMGQIDGLLRANNMDKNQISRIICSIGPGSFTGIRVGLAAAKALGQALAVPVIGVSSLESLALDAAEALEGAEPFIVALDARREQAYWQAFNRHGVAQSAAQLSPLKDIPFEHGPNIAGTGAAAFMGQNAQPIMPLLPHMATGSMDALMRAGAGKAPEDAPLVPLYLRGADAKQPKVPYGVERKS